MEHPATDLSAIDSLIARMDEIEVELVAADDRNRIFHATYNRITHAVRDEVAAGRFTDNAWTEAWDVAFAQFYLDALDGWRQGAAISGPWRIAFEASQVTMPPLRHVLLGMNAHINFDLPQAVLAVVSDADFDDPALLARREADHEHVNRILAARVADEDELLKTEERPGDRTWIDEALKPFNRWGTRRFLKEARTKVWRNAHVLAEARRRGEGEYSVKLAHLESLCTAKVEALNQPGHVLLKLARTGFGVELSA